MDNNTKRIRRMPAVPTGIANLPQSLNDLVRAYIYTDVMRHEPTVVRMRVHVLPWIPVQAAQHRVLRQKQAMLRMGVAAQG